MNLTLADLIFYLGNFNPQEPLSEVIEWLEEYDQNEPLADFLIHKTRDDLGFSVRGDKFPPVSEPEATWPIIQVRK
jgi:hypothetical protein